MERMRIVINFKNTPEDIELYNKLKRHSCMSAYIKDYLRGLVEAIDTKEVVKTEKEEIYDGIDDIIGG